MNHWYFIVPLAVISYALILLCGLIVGYSFRDLKDRVQWLHEDNEARKAEEADDTPGVITTTPQLLEKKARAGKLDTEESAIVTVKTPKQIQEEQDRKLEEELDKLGR